MIRRASSLLLTALLASCKDEAPNETGGAAGDAAGAVTSGGGASSKGLECGGDVCDDVFGCCTETAACGVIAPTHIFASPCVASKHRGGALSTDCSASPEFCQRGNCQTFEGCSLASEAGGAEGSGCGYWIEEWKVVGGEESLHLRVSLGCVSAEELLEP